MKIKIDWEDLSGRNKLGTTFSKPFENEFLKPLVKQVPRNIESNHLTILTLFFCLAAIVSGYLAQTDRLWLLVNALLVVCQYFSDYFDGAVGRERKTGLVKWGFYMDHFFDYLFAQSTFLALILAFPADNAFFIFGLVIAGGFFAHELQKAVTLGKYNVAGYAGFGGTELKFSAAALLALLAIWPHSVLFILVKILIVISGICLATTVFQTQDKLWQIDMNSKRK